MNKKQKSSCFLLSLILLILFAFGDGAIAESQGSFPESVKVEVKIGENGRAYDWIIEKSTGYYWVDRGIVNTARHATKDSLYLNKYGRRIYLSFMVTVSCVGPPECFWDMGERTRKAGYTRQSDFLGQ